jgi:hypothetical protein
MSFPGERLNANSLRTPLADRTFRSLAAYIAHVPGVFGPGGGSLNGVHLRLLHC